MDKQVSTFNWSTTVFMVLVVQVIILGMLASSLLTITPGSIGTIGQLPPMNFIYGASDTTWIISGRTISHLVLMAMNLLIGVLSIHYAIMRKARAVKFIMGSIGAQLVAAACVNAVAMGVILYGGWWHVVGFFAGILSAVTATATAVIFVLILPQLQKVGVASDGYLQHETLL